MSDDETRFEASFVGIGRLLRSEYMGREIARRAELVLNRAKEIAPVSETSAHPGRYLASLKVRVGLNRRRSRIEAYVYSDDPAALHIEKGTRNNEPYNVLTRALDILRGGL